MFVETRKQGKKIKFYLVHTYRVGKKVKRISRYLGSNLNEKTLNKLKKRAEEIINQQLSQDILATELSDEEIKYYNKFESKIKVFHLQKKDWQKFTKEFTYNTNAIEGSTVDYSEVVDLLEHKEKPTSDDEQETINVAEAVKYIKTTKEKLSLQLITKLHKICFNKTKSFAGNFRKVNVVIKDGRGNIVHQGAPPNEIIELLEEFIEWYKKYKRKYPVLFLAAVVHNQFEKIHPFQDGNGRVGRLLLNYILLKHKHPPINIRLEDRGKYYESLQKYDSTGDLKKTLRFLIMQFRKSYKKR
ncbi:MAG: Fic family protein [Nanoarchaeota archaeon]|nr:Fic family protein [Nanoarchaeota archaeon]MBU4241636.1 Fic family protein [Nanoarchaeota archaeon]